LDDRLVDRLDGELRFADRPVVLLVLEVDPEVVAVIHNPPARDILGVVHQPDRLGEVGVVDRQEHQEYRRRPLLRYRLPE
jgi:hypothetical protein